MLSLATAFAAQAHPTLPTAWTATVQEAEVGVVYESYIMVDKPTAENPSAKWTNFTDGSCQRLIFDGPNPAAMRYLLKCDAVDCCTEDQSGNHVEYQIPNVHPAVLAKVKSAGKETISLFNSSTPIEADAWTWRFTLEKFTAYTVGDELVKWVVNVQGNNVTNEYANFTAIPDAQRAAFSSTFAVPPQCQGPQVLKCDGLVSEKSLKFLRAGMPKKQPVTTPTFLQYMKDKSPSDSCTGGHQFCCPAPQDDCNNCPGGAKTGDCCAKNSCCCAFEDLLATA